MPAWLLPALLGGLGGAGLSMLGGEDDEGGIKKTSTLSPEQQELMTGLGSYLNSMVGQGATPYSGSFTAPLSQLESMGLDKMGAYLSGGQSPLVQQGLGTYSDILSGGDPKDAGDFYQKHYAPVENAYLRNTLLPTFKESMVPGGTLRSTGTERGIADVITNFGNAQMSRIGDLVRSGQDRAAGAVGQLGAMSDIESGVPQMEAALQYGQLPRMIEQAELTAQIEEFKRTQPEVSPLLDKMLGFLGTTTQAAYNQPYTPSPFLQFLGAVAPGVGSGIGAAMAAG